MPSIVPLQRFSRWQVKPVSLSEQTLVNCSVPRENQCRRDDLMSQPPTCATSSGKLDGATFYPYTATSSTSALALLPKISRLFPRIQRLLSSAPLLDNLSLSQSMPSNNIPNSSPVKVNRLHPRWKVLLLDCESLPCTFDRPKVTSSAIKAGWHSPFSMIPWHIRKGQQSRQSRSSGRNSERRTRTAGTFVCPVKKRA